MVLTAQGLREDDGPCMELDLLKVEKQKIRLTEEVAAEAKNSNDIALEYLIKKIQKLCKSQSPVLFPDWRRSRGYYSRRNDWFI